MVAVNVHDVSTNKSAKRAVLVIATLAAFLGPFMSSSVNVALPSIGKEFSMGAVSLGWINSAFLLAASTFLIPFGRLGDIYGRKKVYMVGAIIVSIASILIALSSSGSMMILWRVLQGFGSSMIFATGMAILISVFPANERGRVLGINVAAVYLGLSTGPFIGGIITQHFGWRFLFWLNVPVDMILFFILLLTIKGDWAEEKGLKFDLIGSAIMAVALFLTMYGFSKLPNAYAFVMVALGLAGIALFIRYELHLEAPLVDMNLFLHNTVFAFSNLAALINYAATFAVSFMLSLYLQKGRNYDPQMTGLILMSQPAMQAIFSPIAGHLSDRIQPRTMASAGMALTFIGLVPLAMVGQTTPLYFIIGCLLFLGFGFALFSSPNTNAVMSAVEKRYYGVASAVLGTMRQVGMMASMGIVMMILALHMGPAEINAENLGKFVASMRSSFIIFAVLCFAGVFASMARGKVKRGEA